MQHVQQGGRPAPGRRGGRPPARGINQGRRRYRPAPAAKSSKTTSRKNYIL